VDVAVVVGYQLRIVSGGYLVNMTNIKQCLVTIINHTSNTLYCNTSQTTESGLNLRIPSDKQLKRLRKPTESILFEQDTREIYYNNFTENYTTLPKWFVFSISSLLNYFPATLVDIFDEKYICNQWCHVPSIDKIDRIHFEIVLNRMGYDLYSDIIVKYVLKPTETTSLVSHETLKVSYMRGYLIGLGTNTPVVRDDPIGSISKSKTSGCSSCSSCWLSVKNCFRRLLG
jgi:hypothetical protein